MDFLLVLSASGGRTRIQPTRREYDYEYHFIEYEYDWPPKSAATKLRRPVTINLNSKTRH